MKDVTHTTRIAMALPLLACLIAVAPRVAAAQDSQRYTSRSIFPTAAEMATAAAAAAVAASQTSETTHSESKNAATETASDKTTIGAGPETSGRYSIVVARAKLQQKAANIIRQVAGDPLDTSSRVTNAAGGSTPLSLLASPSLPPSPPPTPRAIPTMEISVASFLGVMPGVTTMAQVVNLWGEPQRVSELDGKAAHLYSTEELSHIEVVFEGDKVASILVKLDTPLSEPQVRESLQEELQLVVPVMLPDSEGRSVGEIFPERGVFFLFTPKSRSGADRLVSHIGIEPVAADSFVLRAEASLDERPSDALRDLAYAARIAPNDAKTHWLLSRLLLVRGDVRTALASCERAIAIDETRPLYHLTLAQILIQLNRADEARLYLESTLRVASHASADKAQILVVLGDLYRTSLRPQYERAVEFHSEAIRLTASWSEVTNPSLRAQMQETIFQAHLSAARDVAWGDWNDKEESIQKWLASAAKIVANDESTTSLAVMEDRLFQLAACALATLVGLPDSTPIEPRIEDVLAVGGDIIAATSDPLRQQKYWRETGFALYDAVQIFQLRKAFPEALLYGEQAARHLSRGVADRQSETDAYLLGRLYFRLGAIHAIGMRQHRAAIVWFDKAIPALEPLIATIAPEELGRFGETFVSMGVSFWEVHQYDRAIALTETGLQQMERGVQSGTVPVAALQVPYANLATMYTKLERTEDAQRCLQLAASAQQQTAHPSKMR